MYFQTFWKCVTKTRRSNLSANKSYYLPPTNLIVQIKPNMEKTIKFPGIRAKEGSNFVWGLLSGSKSFILMVEVVAISVKLTDSP